MHHIAIVIFDDFTDIDFFLMRDILGRSRTDWEVRVLGTGRTHRSALGFEVPTAGPLALASAADVVLFVSGYRGVPAVLRDEVFLGSLALDPGRQLIGSICAGSLILARLGLLHERRATTHPDARADLAAMGVNVQEQALVVEGNIATAGGCLSALYLTGWVAERLVGAAKRRQIHRPLIPAGQAALFEKLIRSSIASAQRPVAPHEKQRSPRVCPR